MFLTFAIAYMFPIENGMWEFLVYLQGHLKEPCYITLQQGKRVVYFNSVLIVKT